MSQDGLEEPKRNNLVNQLLEEKKKQREEKQRQAQMQREALENEKRENALKLQMERDEKYRKLMKEKEEKIRMDALKKKLLKEKQTKKLAEERAKQQTTEFVAPKPVEPPTSASKTDGSSLHMKLQRQTIKEKIDKNTYGFDMLQTDDSTDDESRPSSKRPKAPEWSTSKNYFDFL